MQIFYEKSLTQAELLFSQLGNAQAFETSALQAADLRHAEALLVRSTTKVDQKLLSQATKLRYVGTATAGTNHLQLDYLQAQGIHVTSAAGCNADAVAEYVLGVLLARDDQDWQVRNKTVGIVGAGHVGSALAAKLSVLGIAYKLCDPPLAQQGDMRSLVSLDEIMQCDVISLHVPLTYDGAHPTANLFDQKRLSHLHSRQLLINASRGEVLDNQTALAMLQKGGAFSLVLDVWQNEPAILWPLLPYCQLGSAHIAGHSLDAKVRGTYMLYQWLCEQQQQSCNMQLADLLPEAPVIRANSGLDHWSQLKQCLLGIYDPRDDDQLLRAGENQAQKFVNLRKHYAVRREYQGSRVVAAAKVNKNRLNQLGITVLAD